MSENGFELGKLGGQKEQEEVRPRSTLVDVGAEIVTKFSTSRLPALRFFTGAGTLYCKVEYPRAIR